MTRPTFPLDEAWAQNFPVGTVSECQGRLFERTADGGWQPYSHRAGDPLQLSEDYDNSYRVRELAFHLRKEGADERMVTELELIAIAGIVDRHDLLAENQVRCPSCNHYGVVGHDCERCDTTIDGDDR